MKKISLLILILFALIFPIPVFAKVGLGMHILNPSEVTKVKEIFIDNDDEINNQWHYVTIPLSLDDLNKEKEWKQFFIEAKKQHLIPIVRLTSKFENGAWKVPNRKEITSYFQFLDKFQWPYEEKYIIVFNEVNHAKEWGNSIDPVEYVEILSFTSDWAHSEDKNYKILPAAMDLAAPNGRETMEAFTYLDKMYQEDPMIFSKIDYWNSHSYPNPGFSSSPRNTAQNSIRGFQHELDYLKIKTEKDFEVFITETGWINNRYTERWLASYYTYAIQHVWSHPQVKGVTFFILKGDPGPFSEFGFIDRNDQPTSQYFSLKEAIKNTD